VGREVIALVPIGVWGDVFPFVSIGRQLREAGNDVVLVANEHFQGIGGLPFLPHSTEEDYENALSDPKLWSKDEGVHKAWELLAVPALEQAYEHASKADHVFCSPLAVSVHEFPHTMTYTSPAMRDLFPNMPDGIGLWDAWFCDDWVEPVGFQYAQGPAVDSELDEFLKQKPIVVTFGGSNRHAQPLYDAVLEARKGPVLVLSPYVTVSRDNTLVRPAVDLASVLPRCHLFIHHAGIGTCAAAIKAGIYSFMLPMAHDQFDNAARVEKLGRGVVCGIGDLQRLL
jgi:UDP:flavonoid glycosyltransferase YjiC (YdhE family)